MHERVRLQLQECLDSEFVPSWWTRGRTSLLQKDKSKGNLASNYRPVTCLPFLWKLLIGVILDQIYAHLDQEKLLSEEQKGCRKGSRGTDNLLYIFQGDSLSSLVFVLTSIPLSLVLRKAKATYEFSESKINHLIFLDDLKLYSRSEKGLDSLVQTVRVFSEDIGMEFGIQKCTMLVMEKGKIVKLIELPDGKVIKSLQEGESYKYLGILEAENF